MVRGQPRAWTKPEPSLSMGVERDASSEAQVAGRCWRRAPLVV
jgi:hypothetical protein